MKSPVDHSSFRSATDLQELGKLRSQAKSDDPKALEAVAKQFESLFLNMLMQNMRKANEALGGDTLFGSSQSKFYQGMLDQQLGLTMSEGKGIGLSEVLVRQLSPKQGQPAVDPTLAAVSQRFDQALEKTTRAAVDALIKQQASSDEATEAQAVATKPPVDNAIPFESPTAFVAALHPMAEKVGAEAGVDARVLVAQAALETGWGKHMPRHSDGHSSYNLFGIKADQRWSGDRVLVDTLEYRDGIAQREKAAFRAYDSFEHSMWDYLDFLRDSPRYQQALEQAADGEAYLQQLQQAGYATDPAYAQKISGIMNGDVLLAALEQLKES